MLIEVLSPSTESNDRGEKFRRYRRIPSLELYRLVWQSRPLVEPFHRLPNGMWGIGHVVEGVDATLALAAIGIELPLAEVYAGVAFPPLPPETADDATEE